MTTRRDRAFGERLEGLSLSKPQFARIISDLSGQDPKITIVNVYRWAKADDEPTKNKRHPSAAVLAFISILEDNPSLLKRLRNTHSR